MHEFAHDTYLTERIEDQETPPSDYSTVFLPWGPNWDARCVPYVLWDFFFQNSIFKKIQKFQTKVHKIPKNLKKIWMSLQPEALALVKRRRIRWQFTGSSGVRSHHWVAAWLTGTQPGRFRQK